MNILITGGSGLIGKAICQQLLLDNHQITVFSRQHADIVKASCGAVTVIHSLNDYTPDKRFHVIINLAGEPIIDKPWTKQRKVALYDSRVDLTKRLVKQIQQAQTPAKLLLSGSAVGFYGSQTRAVDDMNDNYSSEADFASQLCRDWEKATLSLKNSQTRTIILRTGLVLSSQGGILKKMQIPFKLGLGGQMGDGRQIMSWIHIDDYVRAIQHFINNIDNNENSQQAYNLTAPQPVDNKTFSQALAKAYGWDKLIFNIPAAVVKLIFGKRAIMLLKGQAALPTRLQSEHFNFLFTSIDEALADIIKGN